MLDSRAANWLVAVAKAGDRYGIAAADVSTGRFELASIAPARARRRAGAARRRPRLIAPEPLPGVEAELRKTGFDSLAAERRLKERFEVATLDGFGQFDRAALCAAGGLLAYLDEVARDSLPFLRPPVARSAGDHMMIDAATRESLELTVSASGTRAGSLLASVDRTVTGAGARLLAADLGAPLLDRARIEARLDLVALFERDARLARLAAPAAARLARHRPRARPAGRRPRQPARSRPAARRARRGAARCTTGSPATPSRPPCSPICCRLWSAMARWSTCSSRALVPSPPIDMAQGGYIAEGYDDALDALRATGGEGRRAIAALEARYRGQTGIATLKIRHNNVLGFHIEVPAKNADRLMAAEFGLHPPPDPGRRRPLQRARSARGGAAR